jgi:hypothetical protein
MFKPKAEIDRVMTLQNYGKAGNARVSMVARSRISEASGASNGLKLRMSKEMSKLSPVQLSGGKK